MADPDFASCFGRVVVEHAQMLRQERQVIFTLRSAAPLDKGLCARLLASLQPDYEGFELRIQNLFGYATLDEAALRELMEEMKRDGVPINGFLDRCTIQITGQNITIGVCHGTKFLQEMEFERLLAERSNWKKSWSARSHRRWSSSRRRTRPRPSRWRAST